MPSKGIFTLGVGHVRRKTIEPGEKADQPAKMIRVEVVDLSEHEWDILLALKRELAPEEIRPTPWALRAKEAGVTLDEFYRVAEDLSARKIIGRDFTMSLSLTGCGCTQLIISSRYLSGCTSATSNRRGAARFIDLSGKTDLVALGALIAKAQLLITVDSAPMHLASATQTPQVVLFGQTNPFHWWPLESPALILQGQATSPLREFVPKQPRLPMNQISTQGVIDGMETLLSAPAASPRL